MKVVGGLLPSFSNKKLKGFMTIDNVGEFYMNISQIGKKIFHLFSINSSGTSFRGFELFAYCNYTTIKCIFLFYGQYPSFTINTNILGKDGIQMFRLKQIDGNIYIESESDTTVLEIRVKPLFGINSSQIVMNVSNEIDLSSAKLLAEF